MKRLVHGLPLHPPLTPIPDNATNLAPLRHPQRWDEEPLPFGPVIDTWMGDQAFLPDEPHHLIRDGKVLQAPWLSGTNKDDGAFRVQGQHSRHLGI